MRKKRPHRVNKWIVVQRVSIIFIVVSIILFLYPIIANYFAEQKRGVAVENYDQTVEKLAETKRLTEISDAEEYNRQLFQAQEKGIPVSSPVYKQIMQESTVMGTIDIPAIDIKRMPFFHGTDQKILEDGLGHIPTTSIPVGGENTHAVITGHSGVQNQKLFSDVNKLQKGDVFYITVYKRKLMYRVKKIEEVTPDKTDVIKIEPGQDKVTLLTCTPPGINTYRLLVTGYRELPYQSADKEKIIKRNFWSYEHIVMMLFVVLIIVVVLGILYQRHLDRQWNKFEKEQSVRKEEIRKKREEYDVEKRREDDEN